MPDLKCKCGMEYNITDEYAKKYKEEAFRCGCGELMDFAPKKSKKKKYVEKIVKNLC
jgi:hypothetical protein